MGHDGGRFSVLPFFYRISDALLGVHFALVVASLIFIILLIPVIVYLRLSKEIDVEPVFAQTSLDAAEGFHYLISNVLNQPERYKIQKTEKKDPEQ